MEQQQFKVSWSLGTKLLTGGVLLLIGVIAFLSLSAIFLLREDKRAYLYQTQATEAVLVGREFANTGKRVIGMLRLTLAAVDPSKPADGAGNAAFRTIVENQSDASAVLIYLVKNKGKGLAPELSLYTRSNALESSQSKEAQALQVTPQALAPALDDLLESSYAFLKLKDAAGGPLLGIAVADLKMKSNAAGIPVVIGVLPMADLARQLASSDVTIATRSGRVLLGSRQEGSEELTRDPLFQAALSSQLSSGAREYDVNGVRFLGSFLKAGMDLVVVNRTQWAKAMRATYALTEKFVLLGLMAVAIAVVATLFFSKTLTAPINRLYEATKEVAAGKFDLQLETKSRDEIGALTGSFNLMSRQISSLIQESVKHVQVQNDLLIAATVQQTLLPPETFKTDQVAIYGHYRSAEQCGGDWWGYFSSGDRLTFMIADATGHGFPSALITASARSCASMIQKIAQENPERQFTPAMILRYANRVVHEASHGKIMMTFFTGVIDFSAGTLTFANAGHTPAWLFSKTDAGYKASSLMASGPRLGEGADAEDFEEKTVRIQPDDLLFLYTDGLLEGTNASGAYYGKKRAMNLVRSHAHEGPEKVVKNLVSDFLSHNGHKPFDDDLTVAAALLLPTQSHSEPTQRS